MKTIRKELDFLRREAQRTRGNLRALRRLSKRMHGKEVVHSKSESDDAERMQWEFGVVPDSPASVQASIDSEVEELERQKARIAELKHRLDTQLPISLWGFTFLLVKTLIKRHWPTSTRPQQPGSPQHRHDRKRRLYKPREDF